MKLHITAQSGPAILVILCHSHVCVCACVYLLITQNRAIRPCRPSHSMPLALTLPRGDQRYLLRKSFIRRDKGDTLSLIVQFLLKLCVCVCVCVCVFIKLHMPAQSSPVILVILCHSH